MGEIPSTPNSRQPTKNRNPFQRFRIHLFEASKSFPPAKSECPCRDIRVINCLPHYVPFFHVGSIHLPSHRSIPTMSGKFFDKISSAEYIYGFFSSRSETSSRIPRRRFRVALKLVDTGEFLFGLRSFLSKSS